jgi:hypothetical protein
MCYVGRGLCDELIIRLEEYACRIMCDAEASTMSWPSSELGCCATEKELKT